jgi:hypothetical protein
MSDPTALSAGDNAMFRRRFFCRLPLGAGVVVLLACWWLLMLSLRDVQGSCFSQYGEDPVTGAAKALAHDLDLYDVPGGLALSVWIYAGVSYIPFVLLWACLLLARRSRPDRFLATFSIMGTLLLGLYYAAGFTLAQADLARGSMLCGLAFELVPVTGVVVGGGVILLSAIGALLVERMGHSAAH